MGTIYHYFPIFTHIFRPTFFFLIIQTEQLQQLGLKFILQTKDRVLNTAQAGQSNLSIGTKRPGDSKQ